MRRVALLLAVLFPMRAKRALYNTVFGWSVDRTACIGLSFVDVGRLRMGPGSYIGHGNIVKGLAELDLGEDVYIRNLNQVFAQAVPGFPERRMTVADRTRIMSRHFFDVSGKIEIGADCTIGGRDTQLWSHSVFTRGGTPSLEPRDLTIGDGVYVGARSTLVHCHIPESSVVGAGAVVTRSYEGHRLIITGNPATSREQRDE